MHVSQSGDSPASPKFQNVNEYVGTGELFINSKQTLTSKPTVAVVQTGQVGFGGKFTVLIIWAVDQFWPALGTCGWQAEENWGGIIPLVDKDALPLNWELTFWKNSWNWPELKAWSFVGNSDLSD